MRCTGQSMRGSFSDPSVLFERGISTHSSFGGSGERAFEDAAKEPFLACWEGISSRGVPTRWQTPGRKRIGTGEHTSRGSRRIPLRPALMRPSIYLLSGIQCLLSTRRLVRYRIWRSTGGAAAPARVQLLQSRSGWPRGRGGLRLAGTREPSRWMVKNRGSVKTGLRWAGKWHRLMTFPSTDCRSVVSTFNADTRPLR